MISLIGLLSSLLTTRLGKAIGLVALLLTLFFFWKSINHTSDRMAKIPVISMLEKMQYMERLELINYQSNEILFLGDQDVLETMIEKAAQDSSEAWNKIRSITLKIEKSKVEAEEVKSSLTASEKIVTSNKVKEDSMRRYYGKLGDRFDQFLRKAERGSEATWESDYGTTIATALKTYGANKEALKDARKRKVATSNNGKETVMDLKAEEDEKARDERNEEANKKDDVSNERGALETLQKLWVDEKRDRLKKWQESRKQYGQSSKELDRSAGKRYAIGLQRNITQFETEKQQAQEALEVARSKIDHLMNAIENSKAANESSVGGKKPRLLAVVPASVNLSLDLETVNAHVTADSIIFVSYDSLAYDPVVVVIDSAKHYNIANRQIQLASQEGGLYFDLLQQIQLGVAIIEKSVNQKARSQEMKAKAQTKVANYFNNIFNPMGYKVKVFEGSIPRPELTKVKTIHKVVKKPKQSKVVVPKVKPPVVKPTVSLPDTLRGIDVSHFNGDVNWQEVKSSGYTFSYAKATESTDFNDPKFTENWANMKAAGVRRGAYHFYDPTVNPRKQADFFIKAVGKLEKGDLPPMLDLEGANIGGLSEEKYQQNIVTWLELVEQHFNMQPIIYSDAPFANEHLNYAEFAKYKLWLAQYTDADEPVLPHTWKSQGWYIWQHTARGDIKGIQGYVDEDLMINKP